MTATDLDLDALLDRLLARAAQRDPAPLVNARGDVVNPLAPAGRVSVAPNELIQSAWGNLVFDQSTNQFVSVADRDSQWPAPPDGALCYTTAEQTFWARRGGTWLAFYGGTQPPYTGAGIGTYTDPAGDVWIAKAGVNGGAWKKARDAVAARVWRSAGFTITSTPTMLTFDNAERDPYGFHSLATGFTCPVAGLYRATMHEAFTAAAGSADVRAAKNGAIVYICGGNVYAGAGSGRLLGVADLISCNAGDVLSWQVYATVTLTGAGGQTVTWASWSYQGTG